ncbi:hypothetical protein NOJ28_01635 [Neorhizobium galegae]|uniref:hypothetical protein n=1 Tax=Neorhizobium galegae TaxID=399 RepID=UPI0006211B61|nr:hypothetical protein [Neorhizobium galegae]MCQ1764216.1 hypothetical protein [Neorhizobium galegae]MCQ1846079.1 hypothetical protein [Neorhizobium galegae]CDZ35826.1 Hypothetical protein NGAL_HAMBI1146_15680 [Neorhizobium galegae bv. officinalis]
MGTRKEVPSPGKSAKDIAKEQDDYLEESLEETFPASDPIAPGHPQKPEKRPPVPKRN